MPKRCRLLVVIGTFGRSRGGEIAFSFINLATLLREMGLPPARSSAWIRGAP
jgi:hypothetical protein